MRRLAMFLAAGLVLGASSLAPALADGTVGAGQPLSVGAMQSLTVGAAQASGRPPGVMFTWGQGFATFK